MCLPRGVYDTLDKRNPMTPTISRFFFCRPAANQVIGPFTVDETRELVRSQSIDAESLYTPEGEEQWRSLANSPLWHEVRPPTVFQDEMLDVGPPPPAKKSQRARDYLRLLIGGNILLLGLTWLFVALNPISLMFLAAALVMYNVALLWMMFGVLKEY